MVCKKKPLKIPKIIFQLFKLKNGSIHMKVLMKIIYNIKK